jgi:hypothetical protein
MKSLIVAAFLVFTCAVSYAQQTNSQTQTQPLPPSESSLAPPPEPLFVISNGGIKKEASKEDLQNLNITQIASVEVVLDEESLREYGEKGKNGVMIIFLRQD